MKRIILLLIFLMSSKLSFADETITLLKKMQLALDKNIPEDVEEIYDNHDNLLSKSWMAQERLALSFERRNKLKEAVEIYRKLITSFNGANHQTIVSTDSPAESVFSTNKLPYYYYKLAFLNAQLFMNSNKYIPDIERKKYKRNAEGFLGLCKKVKTDEGDIKIIEEMINEKIKLEDKLAYKSHYYVTFGFISWQDRLYLKNLSTGSKLNISSTALGTSVGFGKKWENAHYEFNFEGMYSIASATASAENASTYSQSSIPVMSFIAGPGIYFKTFSEKVFLGVQLPFSYRKGDWTLPSSNYELEGNNQFGVGYLLQVKFYVGNFGIQTKLGKIFPNQASHWVIGGLYDF